MTRSVDDFSKILTIFLPPFGECPQLVVPGDLVKVSNDWEARRAGWKAHAANCPPTQKGTPTENEYNQP